MAKYPQAKGLMVRKTYTDLVGAIQLMWEHDILPVHPDDDNPIITRWGGQNQPKIYQYPNGSRVELKGLDRSNKVLSAAYDFVYVCQAEELTLDEWEAITGRCLPRASQHRKIRPRYQQVIADCNPDSDLHWIITRENKTGDPRALHKVFHSLHKDNPMLWTTPWDHRSIEEGGTGIWTPDGELEMAKLSNYTGVRYKRGYLGLWVASEGQVYEYDRNVHLINEMPEGWQKWRKYGAIDFGHVDPFVHQWWAVSPQGDMYLYRELYHKGGPKHSMNDMARKIKQIERKNREQIVFRVADHSKGLQEILQDHGIRTRDADKRIEVGIREVEQRLVNTVKKDKNGIYFLAEARHEIDRELEIARQPTRTIDEFGVYLYRSTASALKREEPIPENNHGMDAMRYMAMALGVRGRSVRGFRQRVARRAA